MNHSVVPIFTAGLKSSIALCTGYTDAVATHSGSLTICTETDAGAMHPFVFAPDHPGLLSPF